jgi:hypothetical protein
MHYRLRVDDLREEVFFFAAARPPRAPAVRADIVPRPLVVFFAELFRELDFFAAARPPAAPAFFFCATLPARPPFAPALRTVIVLLFDAVLLAVERLALDFFAVDFFAVVFLAVERFAVERDEVVFLREDVPPLRDDEPPELLLRLLLPLLREEDEDVASPDCARCLLTVRAAISFARFVDRPCFFSESFTCSY